MSHPVMMKQCRERYTEVSCCQDLLSDILTALCVSHCRNTYLNVVLSVSSIIIHYLIKHQRDIAGKQKVVEMAISMLCCQDNTM